MKTRQIFCMLDGSKSNARGRKREGREMEHVDVGTALLSRMLREGVTVKVTSEQRCESGDRKNHVGICTESVPGREDSKFEKPKEEACLERIKQGTPSRGRAGSARLLQSVVPPSKT